MNELRWLIVVNNPKRWSLKVPEAQLVAGRDYLTNPVFFERRRLWVLNLCRSYAYQSVGYYVSLLAEARGHRAMPNVETIQDFKTPTILRTLSSDLTPLIQKTLKPLQSDSFTLSIYFGRNLARRYDLLCRQLSALFPAPLLRAQFKRGEGRWQVENVSPIAASDIPEAHMEFVQEAARDFILSRPATARRKTPARFDLAMLVDTTEANPPSNEAALRKFEKAGDRLGVRVERISKDDYGELTAYDGLFIRATTSVEHYTYRFARRAQAEGMAVIDDPLSIFRCTNKVYLAEALSRRHIRAPRTMILHKDNAQAVKDGIGLPCVLKQPDSAFSHGVIKIKGEAEFLAETKRLLEASELLIVQEFLPTSFDWRIGVLDGKALYACRYQMARGHWQIYNHAAKEIGDRDGMADAVALDQVHEGILGTALKAANIIGDGLYGVDLKEINGRAYVIEVNDNPSIDAEIEDGVLGMGLYETIMGSLLRRMEERRRI